jgi:sortase A
MAMKVIIRQPLVRTRIQTILRCSAYFFFLVGVVVLTGVALTLLDARSFQIRAKNSLEEETRAVSQPKASLPKLPIKTGDVLGRIDIPRIGLSVAIIQGTSSRMLRLGVGHIEGTPVPGETGNSGIAGHRDTFFRGLKDVHPNDDIQLLTMAGVAHYQVEWVKIVAPDDVSVLAPSEESTLTLVTCYPFYLVGSAPKRFVVHARKN